MKHDLKVTIYLIAIFFIAQIVGLAVINQYIDHQKSAETGKAEFKMLPLGIDRPDIAENISWLYILVAVIVGTILVLLIIKFNSRIIWQIWFFIAVVLCLTVSFAGFIPRTVALVIAVLLGIFKVFKPNLYVHNFTEVFMYGGLAAIFVPIINVTSGLIILALISAYDIYAVWKSKHMVKMANFQSESQVFAGLLIPYRSAKGKTKIGFIKRAANEVKAGKTVKKVEIRNAVLGGGDVGFPLIFAGVVMKNLMLADSVLAGFLKTLIIPVFVTIALTYLLFMAKKDKFYPAMPILSAGCIIGYLIILGINMIM